MPGPACPPRTDSRQHCLVCLMLQPNDFFFRRNCRQPSLRSALMGALSMPICYNVCLTFKDTFSLTLLRGVFLAGWLLPHRPCAAPPRLLTAVLRCCAKLFACHRVDHPPCPHRRSGGQRWQNSCTAFAVANGHHPGDSPLLATDSTVAALTVSAIRRLKLLLTISLLPKIELKCRTTIGI